MSDHIDFRSLASGSSDTVIYQSNKTYAVKGNLLALEKRKSKAGQTYFIIAIEPDCNIEPDGNMVTCVTLLQEVVPTDIYVSR